MFIRTRSAIGVAFGLPSLRIRGLHLVIATLAAQFILTFVFVHWQSVTNGDVGLPAIVVMLCLAGASAGCRSAETPQGDAARTIKLAFVTNNSADFWTIAGHSEGTGASRMFALGGEGWRDLALAQFDRVAEHLKPRTSAYYEIWLEDGNGQKTNVADFQPVDEPIYGARYLPRKFKTGFALPEDNCIDVYTQDLGFLAVVTATVNVVGGFLVTDRMLKMFKKKNTFTDFIDCAEFLVDEQYTSPDQLFAMGGSAGGLLMGAVMNLRPDLFHGIVTRVPFVDVVTTILELVRLKGEEGLARPDRSAAQKPPDPAPEEPVNIPAPKDAPASEGYAWPLIAAMAMVPILLVYPFVQKHFTKGVMIGAVKG